MPAGTVKMGDNVKYNTTQRDREGGDGYDPLFNKGYTVLPGWVIAVEGEDDNNNSIVTIQIAFAQGVSDSSAVLEGIHYDGDQNSAEGTWFELP